MTNKIVVIAFDGLDKELIEKFNLKIISQGEIHSINNKEGISSIYTSELFASFVTGKTHELHGVKGLVRPRDKKKQKVLDTLTP